MKRIIVVCALITVLVGVWGCRHTPAEPLNTAPEIKISAETEKSIVKGLNWLLASQSKDGLWRGAGNYTLPVSSMAGLALLSHASEDASMDYIIAVRKLATFFLENADPDSGFLCHNVSKSPTLVDVDDRPAYGHAFGLLFLAQACQSEGIFKEDEQNRMRAVIISAIHFIEKHQHPSGCWYQNYVNGHNEIVTASHVQALMAAQGAGFEVNRKTINKALEFNRICLRKKATPSRNASFTAVQIISGEIDNEPLKKAVKRVLENCKTPEDFDLEKLSFANFRHLYASMVCYHLGGQSWENYSTLSTKWYMSKQNSDGSWPQMTKVHALQPSKEYTTAVACLILQMSKRALPIFKNIDSKSIRKELLDEE